MILNMIRFVFSFSHSPPSPFPLPCLFPSFLLIKGGRRRGGSVNNKKKQTKKLTQNEKPTLQLVTKGLGVLTSVSKGVYHKNFEKDELLKSTCEKIILPNMSFRDSDEIHFEEEFIEYIRADLEGSNSMSRKNGAGDLIIGLRKYYEGPVTQLLGGYINELFNQYKLDRSRNWKQKDAALCLLTSLTVSGSTRLQGVTVVNTMIPIENVFNEHVLPELLSEDSHPVIQADALRFVITFRNQVRFFFPTPLPLLNSPTDPLPPPPHPPSPPPFFICEWK